MNIYENHLTCCKEKIVSLYNIRYIYVDTIKNVIQCRCLKT